VKNLKFSVFTFCFLVIISTPSFGADSFISALLERMNGDLSGSSSFFMPFKERFTQVVRRVRSNYVEPVKNKELVDNAIRGVLSKLDPHSAYLDADDLKELTTATVGKFGGIGIEIVPAKGAIRVVSPIDGTPAYRVGIKPGDLIVKIDGKPVKDMTMRDAVSMMRGKKGTKVLLTIQRKSAPKPIQFEVVRDIIKIETVKYRMLENGYGYIRVSLFQDPTASDLMKAIKELKKESGNHLKGMILDLRNNPGGLLDSATEVAEQFLDSHRLTNKKIVYTQGRTPQINFEALASKRDLLAGIPLVVLINQGSASGSEIVAGALQDHNRAIIVGTRSFGKGSVQTVLPIDGDSAIKLTTALYYTPAGRSIQAEGIQPDVWVYSFQK
jgi:carboxyl-terminal processing protease